MTAPALSRIARFALATSVRANVRAGGVARVEGRGRCDYALLCFCPASR